MNVKKILLSLTNKEGIPFFNENEMMVLKNWNQIQIKCPFHNDKSPSLWINVKSNVYHCFACSNKTENIHWKNVSIGRGSFFYHFLNLFYYKKLNKKLTKQELSSLLEIPINELDNFKNEMSEKVKPLEKTKLKKIPISHLNSYKKDLPDFFIKRLSKFNDFSEDVIEKIKNHFTLMKNEKDDLIIPIFKDWFLRWIYVRRKEEINGSRYHDLESFPKKTFLYNLDEVLDFKFENVILVEWPLNAIKLWGLGYKNVISWFSANLWKEQILELKNFKNIIIWFDNDNAWINWKKEIMKELKWIKGRPKLWHISTPDSKDAYDYNKDEIKNLIESKSYLKYI